MRTFSLIAMLVVASLSSTLAQDCANPLLGALGLPGLPDPISGGDLPYCTNLQGAETCCSADTVAGFQDRANRVIDRLNNYAAGRDLYLAQLRNKFYDRFNDIVEDINEDRLGDVQRIRDTDAGIADQLQGDIDNSNQINNDARQINNEFVGAMADYQAARTTCLNAALRVHTSSWCLACDPNYATQGVYEDGTVTLSDGLCQAINDACLPYFNQNARFNPLIRAREAYWRLISVSGYLNNFTTTSQVTPFNVAEDPYNPLWTQRGVEVPAEWAAGNAEAGQCIDLWGGDQSIAELLTIGNSYPGSGNNNEAPADENVPAEEDVPAEDVPAEETPSEEPIVIVVDPNNSTRLLQDVLAGDRGTWRPDLEATALDFGALRTDPGDYFAASDYSDFFNQNGNQNQNDLTDNNDNTDWDRTDNNN